MRRTAYALLLVLAMGCGSESNTPANIPIVLNDGRLDDDANATIPTALAEIGVADATSPSLEILPPAVPPSMTEALPDVPPVLATNEAQSDAILAPTRTLSETLEELLGTAVVDSTAPVTTTETALDTITVGDLRVVLRAVRVMALDATLTNPSDEHVVVVRASFANTTNRSVVLQVLTDTSLRDAAGRQYSTGVVARVSAQAREPDSLVPAGGSVEGEIAYQVPNTVTTLVWLVRNGSAEAALQVPNIPFAPLEATPSIVAPEETPSALPSAVEGT